MTLSAGPSAPGIIAVGLARGDGWVLVSAALRAVWAAGRKALHDEAAVYLRQQGEALAAPRTAAGTDWYTFTVAFKGVLLEGLEVAFIIATFGGAQHQVGLAAIGAAAAAVIVGGVGVLVRAPLSRVPENTMKFAVGVTRSPGGFG